ncbi:hypothetical protein [Paraliomyxa miuraensis]|uniref:hypothetical protein n=1 Tax=Paraliomyxa miuraensis TaxID=376150 RepID=UPI00225232E7|nr:hypothetical protein [Paraliomyxa miuraensis]MCX4240846.1 hypothetical protein [Paraliomyxa miuraensis]
MTNTFALGDFGVVSNGLFTRMGNISALGVEWSEKTGAPSKLDYHSTSVVTARFEGGATVDVFSDSTTVDAKLVFSFSHNRTFVLRAAKISSLEIDDILAVAAKLHQHASWRRRFRFVTRLYSAQNPLFLASREADTTVTISGKAAVLKKVDLGDFDASINFAVNRQLAIEVAGESGVIALGLARVKVTGMAAEAGTAASNPQIGVEEDADWDEDPVDDV